ncbi:hypothetical protein EYC84_001844 [Monilinia fructicola]|uniref:Uncharacterized protein n=1 Tax=Monilinia fructicola TaxID=38448 RepID=A0A5M9JVS7_MONFR|nr:hypothetical protein EYC84_001844 [Monilinia fructicola]
MLLHSSESPEVPTNVRGALDAAHEAIKAFFILYELFESESKVWWVFNHRAFLECMTIGNILQDVLKEEDGPEKLRRDPMFVRAKGDLVRMIEIMTKMGTGENASQSPVDETSEERLRERRREDERGEEKRREEKRGDETAKLGTVVLTVLSCHAALFHNSPRPSISYLSINPSIHPSICPSVHPAKEKRTKEKTKLPQKGSVSQLTLLAQRS